MANEDRIPGVVFTLENTETKKVKGKLVAEVTLQAHINDLDLFDAISEKLDGLKIYAAEDFQMQVNDLLREDNDDLENQIKQAKRARATAEEHLSQKESFHAQQVEELQREKQTLMVRVKQLEVLERELQDLARA